MRIIGLIGAVLLFSACRKPIETNVPAPPSEAAPATGTTNADETKSFALTEDCGGPPARPACCSEKTEACKQCRAQNSAVIETWRKTCGDWAKIDCAKGKGARSCCTTDEVACRKCRQMADLADQAFNAKCAE